MFVKRTQVEIVVAVAREKGIKDWMRIQLPTFRLSELIDC